MKARDTILAVLEVNTPKVATTRQPERRVTVCWGTQWYYSGGHVWVAQVLVRRSPILWFWRALSVEFPSFGRFDSGHSTISELHWTAMLQMAASTSLERHEILQGTYPQQNSQYHIHVTLMVYW